MKQIEWNKEKSKQLYEKRGVSFEDIVSAIENNKMLDIIENKSINHPSQRIYVLLIDDYVYYVPFVEDDKKIFLKTMYPSRKGTKQYSIGEKMKYKDANGKEIILDDEETATLLDIEAGKYTSIPDKDSEIQRYTQLAQVQQKKNKVLNIRISEEDITSIKVRADEIGLPYQTLVGILLHQFAKKKISIDL